MFHIKLIILKHNAFYRTTYICILIPHFLKRCNSFDNMHYIFNDINDFFKKYNILRISLIIDFFLNVFLIPFTYA